MGRKEYNKDRLGNIKLKQYYPTFIGLCEAKADALVKDDPYAAKVFETYQKLQQAGVIQYHRPGLGVEEMEAEDAALELVEAAQKLKEAKRLYDRALTELRYWQVTASEDGESYWEG